MVKLLPHHLVRYLLSTGQCRLRVRAFARCVLPVATGTSDAFHAATKQAEEKSALVDAPVTVIEWCVAVIRFGRLCVRYNVRDVIVS